MTTANKNELGTPSQKSFTALIALAAVLALLLLNGWFLYINFQKASNQQSWVKHTSDIMSELDSILSDVRAAESDARGLILSGNAADDERFKAHQAEAFDHFASAQSLTADNLVQRDLSTDVKILLDKRFDLLNNLINEFRKENSINTKIRAQINHGREVRDDLTDTVAIMKSMETGLLDIRADLAQRSRTFFLITLVLTTLISLLVIIFTFSQVQRNQSRAIKDADEKARSAWEQANIAEAAGLVAGDKPMDIAASSILTFLSENMKVVASKIYFLEQNKLNLISSRSAIASVTDTANMGLLNDAVRRKEVWQVNDVPADYWKISSGLGEAVPRSLTFLPLTFQDENVGVIEMASFQELTADRVNLLNQLGRTLGIGIHTAHSRRQMQLLLERTQQQAEELQVQQEELRASNEELEQQARALEGQQDVLNLKNQELQMASRELELRSEDLIKSSQYKSDFLAKMSHELRTPLNGLMILSTLLIENKQKNLTDQQIQFAKSINTAGSDLLTLINDILDLSKIEARKLVLRPEAFTVRHFVEQMKISFEPQTSAKHIEFINEIAPEMADQKLFTDRQRVEQVIRNFVSNSLKFTETGSIRLTARPGKLPGTISFEVADTGIGIPKNKQKSIFDAFEQGDGSVSRKYGGTGLGLTISNELAALLGGEITLESEEGAGSKFTLHIPMEIQNTQTEEAKKTTELIERSRRQVSETGGQEPSVTISKQSKAILNSLPKGERTILIVEDDEQFLSSVAEVVRQSGFYPVQANDGEVALAILENHIPSAILLDVKLPGISGLGLLEIVKKRPQLRHIPVHMISATDYQHNALRMGALGFLTKPVTMEKVKSAVSRIENLISKKMRRVLLIEDDDVQSSAVQALIEGNDVEIVASKSGKNALEQVSKGFFDCIILDLTLPDVSGFDLLAELDSLEISLPPIVIYTGKDLSPIEENYLRKYSESIIIKGARSPERLFDEVNLFLHRVESMLPQEKKEMLVSLRAEEAVLRDRTVLVVDDDMRNVFALTSALESKGMQVRVARNGFEALDLVEQYNDINIVLMDIMMPKMDGYECIRRIRENKDERIKSLPIVALTAKAMRGDHEKCIAAGANDYLPKPINLDNLISIMKVWLSKGNLWS